MYSLKCKTHLASHGLSAGEDPVALSASGGFLPACFYGNCGEEDGRAGKMAIMPISGFIPLRRLSLNSKCQSQYESHQFRVTEGH